MPRKPDPRVKALELLGRWTRLAQAHVQLGAGCSCGAAGVTIRAAELERDVLDFLGTKHAAARGQSAISELLKSMAASPTDDAAALLADLERSIASFERTHR